MRWPTRLGAILSALLLVSVSSVAQPVKLAHASAAPVIVLPNPWWWKDNNGNFSQYDTYQYHYGRTHNGVFYPGAGVASYPLGATFQGVAALGPLPGPEGNATAFFTSDDQANGVYEWQCVELVKRYLYLKYGVRPIPAYGYQIVDHYSGNSGAPNIPGYPNLFSKIPNDGTHTIQAGDVLSYGTGENHTAIVSDTSGLDSTGTGTITITEQNVSANGQGSQTVQNWIIKNGVGNGTSSGDTVTGWLRGPATSAWVNNSPPGTTTDWITSLAAASTSNVWAAGYESVAGYGKRPASYYYNGTSWTKFMPWELVGSYVNHWIYGISVSSSGNPFMVGEYASNGQKTLAYRWIGYWKRLTSADPGTSNTLRSVSAAGSNIFAVGVYTPAGGAKQPLLEKWNGSNAFTQQTLALPSGDTYGELNSVSFSSAANGWAVGNSGSSGSGYSYVAYHWNGSTWENPIRGSIFRGNLVSVAVVSDAEAWAVGTQGTTNTPLLLHYTTATGWLEYTDADGGYPPGIKLNSVATDGTDVWIAGWDGSAATTLHYFGYGWARVNIPADFSATVFQAVTVVAGEAWAGGQYGAASNPLAYHYTTP